MTKPSSSGAQPAPNGESHPARCPFCDSANTRKESDFGTTLAYAQYYCNDCRTMFEWLKWEDAPDDRQLPDFLRSRQSPSLTEKFSMPPFSSCHSVGIFLKFKTIVDNKKDSF